MSKLAHIIAIIVVLGLAVWLMAGEQAAQPGPLAMAHAEIAVCSDCHDTLQGVSEENCKTCHFFADPQALHPTLRFHLAEERCLDCHTEHRGDQTVSQMDHTVLNPALECTACHLDAHRGKFGSDCRECHGLSSWSVPEFKHPPEESRDCSRCHEAPLSHEDEGFWKRIEVRHRMEVGEETEPSVDDCWRCHVTHDWRHLRM